MEFSPQSYTPDGVAVFAHDAQLLVRFFRHPQLSKFKSDEAGRPVYDDVEMVSVIQPGEKEEIKVLATDFHRYRFPKQYENFKRGVEEIGTGTPLDHLFPSEPGTILTLKGFNVYSVEQLAALSDSAMQQIPMGRSLADRAKNYISTAQGGSQFHHMQKQIAELTAKLEAMGNAEPQQVQPMRRGPGRPAKQAEGAA